MRGWHSKGDSNLPCRHLSVQTGKTGMCIHIQHSWTWGSPGPVSELKQNFPLSCSLLVDFVLLLHTKLLLKTHCDFILTGPNIPQGGFSGIHVEKGKKPSFLLQQEWPKIPVCPADPWGAWPGNKLGSAALIELLPWDNATRIIGVVLNPFVFAAIKWTRQKPKIFLEKGSGMWAGGTALSLLGFIPSAASHLHSTGN